MVYAAGGTGSLGYDWSNGQASQSASGLAGGSYVIVVTDANNCTASDSIVINEPDVLEANIATSNITCNGANDGAIDLTVTGGTAPFNYNWTPGGNTTEDLSGLSQGTYSVQVTDANGCTANTGSSITEPLALSVSSGTVTPPSSTGGADGTIDMNISGGTAPYTYLWNTGASTEDLTNIGGGVSYTLAVTDANGCPGSAVVFVSDGPVDIEETAPSSPFRIYPNPNNGQFRIFAQLKNHSEVYIEVRNAIGKLVWEEDEITGLSYSKNVNIGHLSPGVYFITLGSKEGITTKKVVLY